jgi:hypothetical protein
MWQQFPDQACRLGSWWQSRTIGWRNRLNRDGGIGIERVSRNADRCTIRNESK